MGHSCYDLTGSDRQAWNAGKKVGTKRPLKPQQIWAIFRPMRERDNGGLHSDLVRQTGRS